MTECAAMRRIGPGRLQFRVFLDSREKIVLCAFGKTWLAPACKDLLDHLVTQETAGDIMEIKAYTL